MDGMMSIVNGVDDNGDVIFSEDQQPYPNPQQQLHHVYQAPPLGFPSSSATETDLFSAELSRLLSFELEKQRIEMEAYLDLEFSQSREMSNMVPGTPLINVVPGQTFGNQSQYSYMPEVIGGSSGGGIMWVVGNGGGSGGHDNNYNLSSPSFTSSLGSWAPAGQKRTIDEESNSITQIPGQRLHLQRRGIEGSSSFSSAVREQTASITPATIAATPTSGMTICTTRNKKIQRSKTKAMGKMGSRNKRSTQKS